MTGDRETLLNAIREFPKEDTPRLAYADWLDEFAQSDADRATAEFVRLSCPLRFKDRQTRAEAQWVDTNWYRLVPGFQGAGPVAWPGIVRRGRTVTVNVMSGGLFQDVLNFIRFRLWRGFVERITFRRFPSSTAPGTLDRVLWKNLGAALVAQPFAVLAVIIPAWQVDRVRLADGKTGWEYSFRRYLIGDELFKRIEAVDPEEDGYTKAFRGPDARKCERLVLSALIAAARRLAVEIFSAGDGMIVPGVP